MFLCSDALTLKNSLCIGRKTHQTPGRLRVQKDRRKDKYLFTFLKSEYIKISLEDYLNQYYLQRSRHLLSDFLLTSRSIVRSQDSKHQLKLKSCSNNLQSTTCWYKLQCFSKWI